MKTEVHLWADETDDVKVQEVELSVDRDSVDIKGLVDGVTVSLDSVDLLRAAAEGLA